MGALVSNLSHIGALLTILAALTNPVRLTTETTTVPGRILVLADDSASMATADLPDGTQRISMVAQLAEALAQPTRNRERRVSHG